MTPLQERLLELAVWWTVPSLLFILVLVLTAPYMDEDEIDSARVTFGGTTRADTQTTPTRETA